jgi:hypothetical protein
MRKLFNIIGAVFLALALSGCATWQAMTQPVHGENAVTTEAPAVRAARVAIDEANASLTGLNNVIGQNIDAAVWSKAQAQAYLDESKAYGRRVDNARELLRGGLLADAKSQAEAVKYLILLMHKRVAAEARKEK